MASSNRNYSVAMFFACGLVAGFILSVMVTSQFNQNSVVRSSYRRWQNRHILSEPFNDVINPVRTTRSPRGTPSWHHRGPTTQAPPTPTRRNTLHIPSVSPANGVPPGRELGGAGAAPGDVQHGGGAEVTSHDAVAAQDSTSRNHIRQFDEHAHHDDTTVADKLFRDVRVFCWILTSEKNHKVKAVHVKATWARRCNKFVFMSDKADPSLPAIQLRALQGREHLTAKTMQAFDYAYKYHLDDFDWFIKSDDDTYVILENLRYMLSAHDPNDSVYFGHHFKTIVKQGYFSGGGGYAVSREALRKFGGRGRQMCRQDGGAEDVEFGQCMEHLGVRTGDSRDVLGRSRFHCFNPATHLHGGYPDWYYKYDKYGAKKGQESISDYPVTFHYVTTEHMYDLEFFTYHLRAYGINVRDVNLNGPVTSRRATSSNVTSSNVTSRPASAGAT